ncbi:hypothetical protein GTP81_14110 [Rugamonas sp. FT107W]|uniref:CBM-cenC domain-containing protein n=1 Tax=Duganella vulcania TaxID=2692166 RepID=A0A845HGG5_9BURK|nr:carbohydrate binding domain-containing protein [Duganella vulcania]MYN17890.1 hypothetical protein [Duganella vulcania]
MSLLLGAAGIGNLAVAQTAPAAIYFSASPTSIEQGRSVNLVWDASTATACSASWSGPIPLSGSYATPPLQAGTNYTINCTSGEQTLSRTIAVDVTPACENCFKKRWIYYYGGLGYKRGTDNASYKKLVELIGRAKQAGYNGIMLNVGGDDSYTSLLKPGEAPDFQANFDEIKKLASDNGIELIPVGGSPDVAAKIDSTLAEALPVSNTPFVVDGSKATPVGATIVSNGGFDKGTEGWYLFDTSVRYDNSEQNGAVKLDQTDPAGRARLHRPFSNLKPHTAYRMSFSVKTQNYDAPLRVQIYAPEKDDKQTEIPLYLSRNYLGWGTANGKWNNQANAIATTQDWTRYNIDFNTRDYDGFRLYIGAWSNGTTKTGYALIDDIDIREIGLAHTVSRPSLPVVVSAEADGGRTVYTEGKDYQVGVESLLIPAGSAIHDKDRLLVSGYQEATNMMPVWNPPGNSCSSKYYDVQKAAYQNIKQLFTSSKFFINYDEWRIMNWDPSCGNLTAGAYLASTTRTMQSMLSRENQNIDMYVWNDMFDPYANAVDHYLAVNGPLLDGWKGLSKDTTIMNWIQNPTGKNLQVPSLKFFSDKKFRQMIALYYDDRSLERTKQWLDSLDAAEKDGVTGVDGFMYTTWQNNSNYDDLEDVSTLIKTHYSKRWPK